MSHATQRTLLAPAGLLLCAVITAGCASSPPADTTSAGSALPSYLEQPVTVTEVVAGTSSTAQYTLGDEPTQEDLSVCVSIPTGADPYWAGAVYGFVTQAQRLGIDAQIYDAGGYDKLPNQVSQLESCLSSGADAVIVAPISDEGIAGVLRQISDAGVPIIAAVNPSTSTAVTAQSAMDTTAMGEIVGDYLAERADDTGKPVTVAALPGPAGQSWAEEQLAGIEEAVNGSAVDIVDIRYGETSTATQQQLVENVLQAYPDLDYIVGNAVAADVAVGAVASSGASTEIISVYETEPVFNAVTDGAILAAGVDPVVLTAAIGMDLAHRALTGDDVSGTKVSIDASVITQDNHPERDANPALAPSGYIPQFSS